MDLVGPNNEYLTPQQVMIAEYSNNKHKAIESIIVHFCSTLTNLQLINNNFAMMVKTERKKTRLLLSLNQKRNNVYCRNWFKNNLRLII